MYITYLCIFIFINYDKIQNTHYTKYDTNEI